MHKLALIAGLLAVTTTAHADNKAARSKTAAITLTESELKWTNVPSRPGAQEAVVEGNPKTGPSHFYVKYPKGFDSGLHHHSSAHGGFVLSGTVILVVDGKETKLPAGSFYWIEANKPHSSKCDPSAECIQAIDVRGKWDVVAK